MDVVERDPVTPIFWCSARSILQALCDKDDTIISTLECFCEAAWVPGRVLTCLRRSIQEKQKRSIHSLRIPKYLATKLSQYHAW